MSEETSSIGLGYIVSKEEPKKEEGLIVVFGDKLVGICVDGISTNDDIYKYIVQLKLSALRTQGNVEDKLGVPPVALQFLNEESIDIMIEMLNGAKELLCNLKKAG